MTLPSKSVLFQFKYSGVKTPVNLDDLMITVIDFLEHYGEVSVVGKPFAAIIGGGSGADRLERLMMKAGYPGDPTGFFENILAVLSGMNCNEPSVVRIGKVTLPYLLVLAILEKLIPGHRFIQIKSVSQLERLNNIRIPEEDRDAIQRVLELYPVRLSMHTIRQMRLSQSVAYQYMPFTDELDDEGAVHTWVGQFHRGIVEQMYQNRIIFVLNMACPVYCRFCFRKHKECRNQAPPRLEHVKQAVNYVRIAEDVKEIVLTGGDPFMNRATLTRAIDGLREIPHVQTLRIATRSIAYYPHLFYQNNAFWMNYLKRKYLELESKGKRIEIATHFIHPSEISIDSLDIISELTTSGISVYVQTPLLKNCNDTGPELAELYGKLRGAGAEMHYIYIPCSPIKGNRTYVTPISTGIDLAARLRAELSDRAIPRICTATAIGKIDWNTSGWAVERVADDPRYLWIRTPYTYEYFSSFAPILQLNKIARVNPEGTLDVKFMADIGDERLFLGSRNPGPSRQPSPAETSDPVSLESSEQPVPDELHRLKAVFPGDSTFRKGIVKSGSDTLFRVHKTRMELDLDASEQEMKQNIDIIRKQDAVTDIVVFRNDDALNSLNALKRLLKSLDRIPRINAVRIRTRKFSEAPEFFSYALLNLFGKLNQVTVVNPRRIEIETRFLHSSEFKPVHRDIAGRLRKKGITIYNITPLLPSINDGREEMLRLVYACRAAGVEFHHLILAGAPEQTEWNRDHPVDIGMLPDLTTWIRRHESGRSIPRYIIQTAIGEVDFGLTSDIVSTTDDGEVLLKLRPYTIEYYRSLDPDFSWPADVDIAGDGHPVVRVPGLIHSPEFLV
ncbi:MAG TPA: radical SAM protein [bacterium]|nr:radical SAM protein [bacterium]